MTRSYRYCCFTVALTLHGCVAAAGAALVENYESSTRGHCADIHIPDAGSPGYSCNEWHIPKSGEAATADNAAANAAKPEQTTASASAANPA